MRVRSIRKYMSTANDAAGATVILNTSGSPGRESVCECVCVCVCVSTLYQV